MLTVAQKEASAKPPQGKNLAALQVKATEQKVRSKEQSIADIIGDGGFKKLSASQAGLLYRECHYENQTRDLGPGGQQHMQVLADLMKRDEWRERDAIQFARLNGKYIIVNGHHRLGGQEQSGKTIEWTLVVYDCNTIGDVAKLYTKFDTNVRTRTNQQVLNALDLSNSLGLSKTLVERLYSAVPLIACNLNTSKTYYDPMVQKLIDRRVEWLEHLAPQARIYEECVQNAERDLKSRLFAHGPLAVAMFTIKHQLPKAREFWTGVADNDGLRRGDPRHTYVTTLNSGRRDHSGTAWMSASLAATAWNAYYDDRRITFLRTVQGAAIRVSGTPLAKA